MIFLLLSVLIFIKTGSYSREELPELLTRYEIDLICILPIWPETFCYTLSEAVLCGIPVIATDIGALSERLRELDCGWLVPYDSSYLEILKIIERIKNYGDEYQKKKWNAGQARIRTIDEMCKDYDQIYQQIFRNPASHFIGYDMQQWFLDQYLLANGLGGNESVMLSKRLAETEHQLWEVYHSATYRVVQIMGSIRIPFKKQLKSLMFCLYRLFKLERQR